MITRPFHRGSALVLLVAAVAATGLLSQSSPVHTAWAQAAPASPSGICGTVSAYTPATTAAAGSITVSTTNQNVTYTIAAGTVLGNSSGVSVPSNVCLAFTLNAAGAIASGSFSANNPIQIMVCGAVTQYTGATSSATGTLSIAGITFTTSLGSAFTGGTPTAGQTQTITATLNGLGIIRYAISA